MRDDRNDLPPELEAIGRNVLDAAFVVHREFGPGLLESTYEHCLAHALTNRGHKVDRQLTLPVVFEGLTLDAGYRLDLIVDDEVIVEVKAVEALAPVHDAQLITYLRLARRRLGYLINFNVALLRQGIRRRILSAPSP